MDLANLKFETYNDFNYQSTKIYLAAEDKKESSNLSHVFEFVTFCFPWPRKSGVISVDKLRFQTKTKTQTKNLKFATDNYNNNGLKATTTWF